MAEGFRNPQVARGMPVSFEANFKDKYIVAIFHIGRNTIGVRFESPDQLLYFCTEMIEKAAVVWPDNEYIREYKRS